MDNIKKETMELQKAYRKGKIKEENMTAREIQELKKLYYEQIEFLEKSIELKKKEISNKKKNKSYLNNLKNLAIYSPDFCISNNSL